MNFEGYFTERDDVLENRKGITDPVEMEAMEEIAVPVRAMELLTSPPEGKMDFDYLKRIHMHLFSDLYPMAGQVRTVDIAKAGSVFCYARFIDDEQRRIFANLAQRFGGEPMPREEFISALATLSADLNALHPFREGNGRAIRMFLVLLAARCGYHLDFESVPIEDVHRADIAGFRGDLTPLEGLYSTILSEA